MTDMRSALLPEGRLAANAPSSGRGAKIAYLVLVHRYPEQFKRMFRAIHAPGNLYVVHVDENSGPAMEDDIRAFLEPYQGAEVLPARPAR